MSNKLFMALSTNTVIATNRPSKAQKVQHKNSINHPVDLLGFLEDLYFVLSFHLLRNKLAFSIVMNNPSFALAQFRLY